MVAERYVSAAEPQDELDSLASWKGPDGRNWLIVTAKSSHRLVVFDADTGRRLRTVGEEGKALGAFRRPNGVAVHRDRLFVVERDNRRVQVLALPEFRPLASFGEDELRSPYGIWLDATEPGELVAYVTDSFMYGEHYDELPPLEEMNQRVRRYRLRFEPDGRMHAGYAGAFGETDREQALRIVESLAGDPANDRLLIADEYRPASTLREYRFDGRATGRSLPPDSFAAEAEGVALWTCGDGGYWITVDQLAPYTHFHLFDRVTLAPVGSFTGRSTAHTDGIALNAQPSQAFPSGALFAVHDDKAIAAFDLAEIARTLKLDPACTR
ncbi:MAG TPA: phytase [Lysobacter sp.]|nr:phytase [Lysobacter sp.]